MLYFLDKSTANQYQALKEKNIEAQTNLNRIQKDLTSAKQFQAQLKNLSYLTSKHIYWSSFFDELSKHIFNKTRLVSIEGDTTGNKIHIEGNVGSYESLAKLMLGLSTSDKFSQVKLLSASPTTAEESGYLFSIDITINSNVFVKK